MIANLITGGVCHRFPDLKFVSVESGVGWLPFALEHLDWQWLNCGVPQEHPEYDLLPSEYFKRQMYGCFWFETASVRAAIDQMGPGCFLYESDFPHPTSMAPGPASSAVEPREYIAEQLGDLPEDVLRPSSTTTRPRSTTSTEPSTGAAGSSPARRPVRLSASAAGCRHDSEDAGGTFGVVAVGAVGRGTAGIEGDEDPIAGRQPDRWVHHLGVEAVLADGQHDVDVAAAERHVHDVGLEADLTVAERAVGAHVEVVAADRSTTGPAPDGSRSPPSSGRCHRTASRPRRRRAAAGCPCR